MWRGGSPRGRGSRDTSLTGVAIAQAGSVYVKHRIFPVFRLLNRAFRFLAIESRQSGVAQRTAPSTHPMAHLRERTAACSARRGQAHERVVS